MNSYAGSNCCFLLTSKLLNQELIHLVHSGAPLPATSHPSTSTSSLALDFLDPPSLDGLLEPVSIGHLLGWKTATLTGLLSWELTCPHPRSDWKWISFSQCGYVSSVGIIFAVVPDFRINDMRLTSFFEVAMLRRSWSVAPSCFVS